MRINKTDAGTPSGLSPDVTKVQAGDFVTVLKFPETIKADVRIKDEEKELFLRTLIECNSGEIKIKFSPHYGIITSGAFKLVINNGVICQESASGKRTRFDIENFHIVIEANDKTVHLVPIKDTPRIFSEISADQFL